VKTPTEIQDLVADVVHRHPSAQIELDPLPSGVCFLWVALEGREFVLEHDPKRGTGVSENHSNTPLFAGHDRAFDRLSDAVAKFQSLLVSATSARAALSRG
jgi:hypothetical protein